MPEIEYDWNSGDARFRIGASAYHLEHHAGYEVYYLYRDGKFVGDYDDMQSPEDIAERLQEASVTVLGDPWDKPCDGEPA